MSYISDRIFKIWSYSVSHSFLLLRSTNNEEDEVLREGYNIDIEFGGVGYLNLPVILQGISIQEIKEDIPEKFKRYLPSLGHRVFEIKSDETYYIIAGSYRVGKNNWGDNEDRIFNPSLEYDEILATS
jgi:hypothetical protein